MHSVLSKILKIQSYNIVFLGLIQSYQGQIQVKKKQKNIQNLELVLQPTLYFLPLPGPVCLSVGSLALDQQKVQKGQLSKVWL